MLTVRNVILLAASVVLLITAISLPRELFLEGPPTFETIDIIALALSLAVALPLAWISLRDDGGAGGTMSLFDVAASICSIAFGLYLAVTMAVDPKRFTWLLVEDGWGEWASAWTLFAGGAVAVLALILRRAQNWLEWLFIAGFGLAMVVVGMEEVSWFQRVLHLETPDWLAEVNWQKEINFHNLQTNYYENAYYAGSALLLAGGRLLLALPDTPRIFARVKAYAPATPSFVMVALSCAFTWDMWRIIFIEAALGLVLAMLVVEIVLALRNRQSLAAWLYATTLVATLAIQALFLAYGPAMTRHWDATEAREWLIAIALALYSVQLAFPRTAEPSPSQAREA